MSKHAVLVALFAVTALSTGSASARQAPPAPDYSAVQIKATDLGNRTWMLEGQGGNMLLVAGDDGVILVDTEFAPLHDKIRAAVANLSPQPIKYVVNTHLHGDHTGGNSAFWVEGVPIVANANLKASMAAGTTNALTGAKTAPAPGSSLPTLAYGETKSLAMKGRTVQLVHMHNAHTQGDTAVWVPDANVVATGDIVSWGARYPNIDVGDKGGINGLIAAVDAFLKRSNGATKIVPGHGALMTKADLTAYRKLLADSRDAVRKLKAEGKSENDTVTAKPLAGDIQTRAGATDQASANFVRLIYKSL